MDGDGRTIEVCREFMHERCKRSDDECRYAHPPPHVEVNTNGRVTCCVDSLRDKCKRDNPPCKYLHPPQHLKDQLLMVGRNLRNSDSYRGGFASGGSGGGGGGGYSRASAAPRAASGGMDFMRDEFASIYPFFNSVPGQPEFLGSPPLAGGRKSSWMDSQDRSSRSNTIEVCREFLRGKCNRNLEDCRFAHPPSNMNIGSDNVITVCMDFVRGNCGRDSCRYFHPPPHLQNKLRVAGGGGSGGSSGRKRPFPSGYNNGDGFEAAKRPAPDDLFA